jgi:hypothetical protein
MLMNFHMHSFNGTCFQHLIFTEVTVQSSWNYFFLCPYFAWPLRPYTRFVYPWAMQLSRGFKSQIIGPHLFIWNQANADVQMKWYDILLWKLRYVFFQLRANAFVKHCHTHCTTCRLERRIHPRALLNHQTKPSTSNKITDLCYSLRITEGVLLLCLLHGYRCKKQ